MRAAAADHLARRVEIGFAHGQPLGERERVARLDQDVEAPALDLRPFVESGARGSGRSVAHRLAHGSSGSCSYRRTLQRFVRSPNAQISLGIGLGGSGARRGVSRQRFVPDNTRLVSRLGIAVVHPDHDPRSRENGASFTVTSRRAIRAPYVAPPARQAIQSATLKAHPTTTQTMPMATSARYTPGGTRTMRLSLFTPRAYALMLPRPFSPELASELLKARLEDAALPVDVGLQLLLPPLEVGRDLGEAALEPLARPRRRRGRAARRAPSRLRGRSCPTDRSSSRARRFAASSRAVLTTAANCCDGLGCVRRDGAFDLAVELLDLAAGDVLEARLDPLGRVVLLALDLLGELAFSAREPLLELVQRAPSFGRVDVELVRREGERLGERALDVGAESSRAPRAAPRSRRRTARRRRASAARRRSAPAPGGAGDRRSAPSSPRRCDRDPPPSRRGAARPAPEPRRASS